MIQDGFPGTFQKSHYFQSQLGLCSIWGKLQRGPSPLPTYLKSKTLVILTSVGPPAVLFNSCGWPVMSDCHAQPMLSPCSSLQCKVLELFKKKLIIDLSGLAAKCAAPLILENLFSRAPLGSQFLFHTWPEPLEGWPNSILACKICLK